MARRFDLARGLDSSIIPNLARSFRDDVQLKQYYLDGVMPTGKTLGVGSYGSVVEVKYRQVCCAAKRMHELLLNPENEGVEQIVQKYQQECQLMASLRHPNITQFLGLCFLEGSELPLLVMEKLEMSVYDLLECAPNIPLPVKLSILTDTCSGLVYLHGMPSPIVHRDLTARNVLLTSSLTAKITDMGNSRILDLSSAKLAQTMSKLPGTLVYMPPEAVNKRHRYGPSLDVFSFGHLALYILTQLFPEDLLPATHMDQYNPGRIIGRSEVERREVYIKKLELQFAEQYPMLVEIVTNCLHNAPQERPSAEQLLVTLQPVKMEMGITLGGALLNVAHIIHIKEIKQKDKEIKELKDIRVRLETECRELTAAKIALEDEKNDLEISNIRIAAERSLLMTENNQWKTENDQLMTENNHLKTEKRQINTEKNQLKTENSQLKIENNQLKTEKNQLKAENSYLKMENCQVTAENDQIKTENSQLKNESDPPNSMISKLAYEKLQLETRYQQEIFQLKHLHELDKYSLQTELELVRKGEQASSVNENNESLMRKNFTFPLELDWRRGPAMPVAMSGYFQIVEINGTLYVGGGQTDRSKDGYIVMAYAVQSCQWYNLPAYTTKWFAMTTINCNLVLVGGVAENYSESSELGEWQPYSNQWTHPFPPMSTPRYDASATSYKHWLVVAGGCHGVRFHSIEVLDVSNMQWSTRPSTPTPLKEIKSTKLEDTWYLMGGRCAGRDYVPDVYSISLEALVSQLASENSHVWKKLPSLDCLLSCPLIIGGSLLAVGGEDMKSKKPVSTIQRYVSETNTWVQAGLLPHAVCNCTCIMTSDRIHIIGGHDGKTKLKNIFTSSIF